MLKCLYSQRNNTYIYFWIIGNGTEYSKIEQWINKYNIKNVRLSFWKVKEEYDKIVAASDVGMIFLDHRFTIPNFPSRILGYMSAKIPILAVTNKATDVGKVIEENDFGWWCKSKSLREFDMKIKRILSTDRKLMGVKGYKYLENKYHISICYKQIIEKMSI